MWSGAGKVGSENGAPPSPAGFQLSARADFFGCLMGPGTTQPARDQSCRPLLNTRDEAHAGHLRFGPEQVASVKRLHVIPMDTNLADTANFLKAHVTQVFLCMQMCGETLPATALVTDPVAAWGAFSRDLSLREARVPTLAGVARSALEIQMEIYECARRFLQAGHAAPYVPRAREAVKRLGQVLEALEKWDPNEPQASPLPTMLDWPLKYCLLEEARVEHGLMWESPELRMLDQQYAGLGEDSLYFNLRPQLVCLVSDEEIDRRTREPPEDARGWLLGTLLDRIPRGAILECGWDHVIVRGRAKNGATGRYVLALPDPASGTRAACEPILAAEPLESALRRLGLRKIPSPAVPLISPAAPVGTQPPVATAPYYAPIPLQGN